MDHERERSLFKVLNNLYFQSRVGSLPYFMNKHQQSKVCKQSILCYTSTRYQHDCVRTVILLNPDFVRLDIRTT